MVGFRALPDEHGQPGIAVLEQAVPPGLDAVVAGNLGTRLATEVLQSLDQGIDLGMPQQAGDESQLPLARDMRTHVPGLEDGCAQLFIQWQAVERRPGQFHQSLAQLEQRLGVALALALAVAWTEYR